VLNFLLRESVRTGSTQPLDMALQTLGAMAGGGIRDQLGGGFHRYTVDPQWRVPHFEKMLYDQAQLSTSYTEAYQMTKDPALAEAARGTLDYVLRDMRSREGGFFSAEGADSRIAPTDVRQVEGAFYVWTADEIRAALGDDLARVFAFRYGVQESGNAPAQLAVDRDLRGKNVLFIAHSLAETAAAFNRPEGETRRQLERAADQLRHARGLRPRPLRDDKVLVSWNGLMIAALARGAQAFDEPRYLDAARAAARFIESRMYDARANLLKRRYRQGEARIAAVLEDYAFLISGLLDLYEASFEVKWLSWAVRLQARQDQLFWATADGGYFSTRARAPDLLIRVKDDYDGAEPSGNSVAAMNLLRLSQITDRPAWGAKADAIFRAMGPRLDRSPGSFPQLAVAINFRSAKTRQIIVAGQPGAADTRVMLRLVHDRFMPNRILLLADNGPAQQQLAKWLPFIGSMDRRDGRATIYICENYTCRLPTNDPETAARQLAGN
jgi:uncharacterized protein YyaL (SSP411 family)